MTASVYKRLLLLTLILTILSAIRCPTSPTRSRGLLKSFGKTVSRSFNRMVSGSSARSRSSSSGSHGDSGNESEVEQPASGNSSGGRLPRSQSPSPSNQGGGSSSSSAAPTINKMYGSLQRVHLNRASEEINRRGDANVVQNMQVQMFFNIIQGMQRTAANDECGKPSGVGRGRRPGSAQCIQQFAEFMKIPPQYRGDCSDAINAMCQKWHGNSAGSFCTFFVREQMRSSSTYGGFYATLADCVKGIQHELFMSDQLSSVGINPPHSPPKPLLPPHYSPDH